VSGGAAGMAFPTNSAHEAMRQEIVNGRLLPNERLVESELSSRLGYPRAAIRTALVLLQQEGLVSREPNRGARVRLIDIDEALEIIDAREALEGVVARHAAINATPADIADLQEILAHMRDLLDRGDVLAASDESGVLHGRLIDIARHETAARLISMLKSQTVRFQYRTILVPGRPEEAYTEHRAMVEAIVAKDPDQAERATRRHLANIRDALRLQGDAHRELR
jgi:DNA-binding GntR family transcriptional regulator